MAEILIVGARIRANSAEYLIFAASWCAIPSKTDLPLMHIAYGKISVTGDCCTQSFNSRTFPGNV